MCALALWRLTMISGDSNCALTPTPVSLTQPAQQSATPRHMRATRYIACISIQPYPAAESSTRPTPTVPLLRAAGKCRGLGPRPGERHGCTVRVGTPSSRRLATCAGTSCAASAALDQAARSAARAHPAVAPQPAHRGGIRPLVPRVHTFPRRAPSGGNGRRRGRGVPGPPPPSPIAPAVVHFPFPRPPARRAAPPSPLPGARHAADPPAHHPVAARRRLAAGVAGPRRPRRRLPARRAVRLGRPRLHAHLGARAGTTTTRS